MSWAWRCDRCGLMVPPIEQDGRVILPKAWSRRGREDFCGNCTADRPGLVVPLRADLP